MARSENERNLGADVPKELFERIESYICSHYSLKKKQLVIAMTELFLSLPDDLQALVLNASPKSKTFVKLVQRIVDLRIKTILPDALQADPEDSKSSKVAINESVENVRYFIQHKLPSPQQRKELQRLRDLLGAEFPKEKKKRKRG